MGFSTIRDDSVLTRECVIRKKLESVAVGHDSAVIDLEEIRSHIGDPIFNG